MTCIHSKAKCYSSEHFGIRLETMLIDAMQSENFTPYEIANFVNFEYSKLVLKMHYPLLVETTNMSEEQQQDLCKRYFKRTHKIFGRTFRICSQIYAWQFRACQEELKNLGLINEDAQY